MQLPAGDGELVRIVDAAFADSARRSGAWLACGPGCTQCCTGVFRITRLDAVRLQVGQAELQARDPDAATRLRERLRASRQRLAPEFPGDAASGLLHDSPEASLLFEDFGNDEVCPALEPATGLCAMYAHRPLTCRTFGPPVMTDDGGLGMCELCFQGAPEQAVLQAAMADPPVDLERDLLAALDRTGETIVPFAFASD